MVSARRACRRACRAERLPGGRGGVVSVSGVGVTRRSYNGRQHSCTVTKRFTIYRARRQPRGRPRAQHHNIPGNFKLAYRERFINSPLSPRVFTVYDPRFLFMREQHAVLLLPVCWSRTRSIKYAPRTAIVDRRHCCHHHQCQSGARTKLGRRGGDFPGSPCKLYGQRASSGRCQDGRSRRWQPRPTTDGTPAAARGMNDGTAMRWPWWGSYRVAAGHAPS